MVSGFVDIPYQDKELVQNMVQRLQKYSGGPGGTAYIYNDYGLFYFLADVVNPTRYSVTTWINGPMNEEVIQDLRAKKPSCIIGTESKQTSGPYNLQSTSGRLHPGSLSRGGPLGRFCFYEGKYLSRD